MVGSAPSWVYGLKSSEFPCHWSSLLCWNWSGKNFFPSYQPNDPIFLHFLKAFDCLLSVATTKTDFLTWITYLRFVLRSFAGNSSFINRFWQLLHRIKTCENLHFRSLSFHSPWTSISYYFRLRYHPMTDCVLFFVKTTNYRTKSWLANLFRELLRFVIRLMRWQIERLRLRLPLSCFGSTVTG